MTDDNSKENRLANFEKKFLAEPRNTPEEIAEFKEARNSRLGTSRQWAAMQEDESIIVDTYQKLLNGITGHSEGISLPGDPDYNELCKLHNLKKPGDASTIFKRLIDGEWVVVDDLE